MKERAMEGDSIDFSEKGVNGSVEGRKEGSKRKIKRSVAPLEHRMRGGGEPVPKIEVMNVVVWFEGERGENKVDLLKLTQIIRGEVGEVKYGRILGDGNLRIGCNTEQQAEKSKKNE